MSDGYYAYSWINEKSSFKGCSFHSMQNLMDDLVKKHNILNRKMKTLNNQILNLERQISEIDKKIKREKRKNVTS